jgi:hypothetical protein
MNDKLKHTPPPWKVASYKNYAYTTSEIQFGTEGECVAEVVHEIEDARLIAAAPEMLKALIYVLDERKRGVDNGKTDNMIQDIIEKATGQKIEDLI